jgi:glycosyltransferase involved in cell wall biosynthesis
MSKVIVFMGFNDPSTYKRGVENVIMSQAAASYSDRKYYIFLHADATKVFRWGNLCCIGVKKDLWGYLRINRLIRKIINQNPEELIIHSHHYLISFFLKLRTDIFTVHDGLHYQAVQGNRSKLVQRLHAFIEKNVYRRSRFLHFISEFTRRQALEDGVHQSKIRIIPNTSPFERSVIDSKPRHGQKQSVLVVRSIEARAGIGLVLEAAKQCRTDNFHFFIAGKGPLLEEYQKKAKGEEISNVTFLGYISDDELMRQYAAADLVLVPSLFGEGFGLPVIEGYLFDKPVIASNVCAIPEVIASDEFLFENEVAEIVAALKKVSVSKYPAHYFRRWYDRHFSNQVILAAYSKLYTEASMV